ncbi:uncharacterized protein [Garra rufa]|uniref:uncharacterized protein n=1 Tax=Garra rufa TaxID=137080 RepID=UPI003CCE7FCA
MAVTMLTTSLTAEPGAFSEMGATSGVVSERSIRFGKLLIGGQGAASDGEIKTSDLMSTESEYQSNVEAPSWVAKAKLRRLGPSVHCSNDSMTLRIPGPRTPQFMVDRGEESPVPLSKMPASCGFSLNRQRRDVSLVAPYRGCHVRQQGGSFILPLIIMGAPVQISCPMSPRLPKVSCFPSGMIISFDVRADDVKIKVDGSWQPLLLTYSMCSFTLDTAGGSLVVTAPFTGSCWEMTDNERHLPLMYRDREVTLFCPLTPPTIAPHDPTVPDTVKDPLDMQQMFYPFPIKSPWWPYPHVLPPTVPPSTTTTPPPQDPVQHPMYPMPMFNPYHFYPKHAPPQPHHPWYPMFPPYMYGFKSPAEVTTAATTTPPTTAAPLDQYAQYPMFPMFYGHQPIKSYRSPAVQYPFMPPYPKDPQYPQDTVFGPRSSK